MGALVFDLRLILIELQDSSDITSKNWIWLKICEPSLFFSETQFPSQITSKIRLELKEIIGGYILKPNIRQKVQILNSLIENRRKFRQNKFKREYLEFFNIHSVAICHKK